MPDKKTRKRRYTAPPYTRIRIELQWNRSSGQKTLASITFGFLAHEWLFEDVVRRFCESFGCPIPPDLEPKAALARQVYAQSYDADMLRKLADATVAGSAISHNRKPSTRRGNNKPKPVDEAEPARKTKADA